MNRKIKAKVSDRIFEYVGQIFDASFRTVLAELLQNSRRSGALKVKLELSSLEDGGVRVSVADDGCGIADMQELLDLASTGWDEAVGEAEIPAGMGFFALVSFSDKPVSVASLNWRTEISKDVFQGRGEAEVEETDEIVNGTRIEFEVPSLSVSNAAHVVRDVSRYCGVVVEFTHFEATTLLKPERFVPDEYLLVEDRKLGVRIGRPPTDSYYSRDSDRWHAEFNFYGVRLSETIEKGDLVAPGMQHYVDIRHLRELKMVHPARNALVKDESFERLKLLLHRASYEWYARNMKGAHRLAYKFYKEAQRIGIDIGESVPRWSFGAYGSQDACDSWDVNWERRGVVVDECGVHNSAEILMEYLNRGEQADVLPCVSRKLPSNEPEGYSWYTEKPRLVDVRIRFDLDGESVDVAFDEFESGVDGEFFLFVSNLRVVFVMADGSTETEELPYLPVLDSSTVLEIDDLVTWNSGEDNAFLVDSAGVDGSSCSDVYEILLRTVFRPGENSDPDTSSTILSDEFFSALRELFYKERGDREALNDLFAEKLKNSIEWESKKRNWTMHCRGGKLELLIPPPRDSDGKGERNE
jgi:hypothetical protein